METFERPFPALTPAQRYKLDSAPPDPSFTPHLLAGA
eukprot:COSAG04_NODE_1768_length_5630_cov_4.742904_4_plen_36_part_01